MTPHLLEAQLNAQMMKIARQMLRSRTPPC